MARQTVEIDKELWQKFLKRLVDLYGSAYGSKKKEALNEAIRLWLEVKAATLPRKPAAERMVELFQRTEVSAMVLDLLGEEETVIPLKAERNILIEALRQRLR